MSEFQRAISDMTEALPLSVDLDATIDDNCAEVLRPWVALAEDELLDIGELEDALRTIPNSDMKLRALRVVDDMNVIAADQLRRLLLLPLLADLEVLMLPTCNLGIEGGAVLAAAVLPKLRFLDVRQTAIGDVGARAIASSRLGSRLEHLSIAGAYLTAEGFQALLESPLGKRKASLHVEEEGQRESIVPTLMERLFHLGKGDESAVAGAFARLLQHPALTQESRDELRYQWDLVGSN
jgi:hypothetical protein